MSRPNCSRPAGAVNRKCWHQGSQGRHGRGPRGSPGRRPHWSDV